MKINNIRRSVALITISAAFAGSVPAWAHPHVIVDGREEIVFDAQNNITAIRSMWTFDKAYSSFASIGMDKNGDGKLSREELEPLAELNATSLSEYEYFTHLTIGAKEFSFKPPVDYYVTDDKGQLTLHFTLPLATPVKVTGKTVLVIFDPEYFVAFRFNGKSGSLIDAAGGCSIEYKPPRELDAATLAKISAVPAEQHDLPPELREAAQELENHFILQCPK